MPWLVNELGNLSTHWCTRAELAAVLGSLARIPALSAAMVRHPTELPFVCNGSQSHGKHCTSCAKLGWGRPCRSFYCIAQM